MPSVPHVPWRTCIGCRRSFPARELVRLVLRPSCTTTTTAQAVSLLVAPEGRHPGGRGAWVHPTDSCVRAAVKAGAFSRAFRTAIPPIDAASLTASILASR